jgi:hypothetical protein
LRRAEKISQRFGEEVRLGAFAGFDLYLRSSFNNAPELVLRGKNSYGARVTDTALGTIRSLEAVAQGFEERMAHLKADVKNSQKRATEFEIKVGVLFDNEDRYHLLVKRRAEIESKLDLTKSQTPVQIEDILQVSNEKTNQAARATTKYNQSSHKKTVIRA